MSRKQRRYKKTPVNYKAWIVSIVSIVVALAVAGGTVYFLHNKSDETATSLQISTTDQKETVATFDQVESTQASTQPSDNASPVDIEQPDDLTEILNQTDYDYDSIQELGCEQLVTVWGDGTSADIKFYEFIDGKWTEYPQLECDGFVGQMGTVDNMSEDISGTPKGLYPIGEAFYRNTKPQTALDIFKITQDTYWVDDPDSKFYNQRVEGTQNKDWDSAEHMNDYSNYDYGFVINYNMPAQYNAGSAIFFHVGYNITAGCVAASEEMVIQYLLNLDKAKNPYILVE